MYLHASDLHALSHSPLQSRPTGTTWTCSHTKQKRLLNVQCINLKRQHASRQSEGSNTLFIPSQVGSIPLHFASTPQTRISLPALRLKPSSQLYSAVEPNVVELMFTIPLLGLLKSPQSMTVQECGRIYI